MEFGSVGSICVWGVQGRFEEVFLAFAVAFALALSIEERDTGISTETMDTHLGDLHGDNTGIQHLKAMSCAEEIDRGLPCINTFHFFILS
jgi:hypothetical protein